MFKHHRHELQVHDVRSAGGATTPQTAQLRQQQAAARQAQQGRNAETPEATAAAEAFRQRACAVGETMDRATYVRQRMTDEAVTSPQARQAFEAEFARYAGDDNQINMGELAQSMGDYELSRANPEALRARGVTGSGPSVSANQAAINTWLQSPAGQAYAQQNPTMVTTTTNAQGQRVASIAVDGREGPMTRSALAAMGQDTRSSNAITEVEAISGQPAPAFADAQRLPQLMNNIPAGHPSRERAQAMANIGTQSAIRAIAENTEAPAAQRAEQIGKLAENLPEGEARKAAQEQAQALAREAEEPGVMERIGTGVLETLVPPYAIANQMQRYAAGEQGLGTTVFNSVMSVVPGYSLVRNLFE